MADAEFKPSIRIYRTWEDGRIEDARQDFALEHLGGVVPTVGDYILNPAIRPQFPEGDPRRRTFWKVTARYLRPRDLDDYVAIVVEDVEAGEKEADLLA